MNTLQLSAQSTPATGVRLPGYIADKHGCGIVHLGVGAFHRAHQAVYTDDALAASGGDWRIIGVSLRSTGIADALNAQDGRYTLIERSSDQSTARIIASLGKVLAASREPESVLSTMIAPATHIVSLTVTEKAYGIDRGSGGIDSGDPVIASDLANPQNPAGAIGLIVETLRLRRKRCLAPYTVLCCDNLPDNGRLLATAVVDFARRLDPQLANWIEAEVAFPSTMVDRITPAATPETLAEAQRLTGCTDLAAIETEHFCQWVIEDNFPQGRPAWEAGGAIFAPDVAPYEQMKLRMLNGSHSMLAYAGFLTGQEYVRDVMRDHALSSLVARHLKSAAATLTPLSGMDLSVYASDLIARFTNPTIAHATHQIAMDGTQKLPQRIVEPALHALEYRQDVRPFAFAVACWMRYCTGLTDTNKSYALRDPMEQQIKSLVEQAGKNPEAISRKLHELPGIFPPKLTQSHSWQAIVLRRLSLMLEKGMRAAIELEAATDKDTRGSF